MLMQLNMVSFMNKPIEWEYQLGDFPDYNNLHVKALNPYQIYCEVLEGNHNIPISFEDWKKADKDSTYFGVYKSQNNAIFINNCITNEEKFKQVLRHELIHAFLSYNMPTNTDYDDEDICEVFSKHYDEYISFIETVTNVCLKRYKKEQK